MENQDINRSLKVGAFVLGGVVIFLSVLFYLGREGNMFNKTFTVSAIFKNVEGLKEGDNVWLSGVKIGTVKRVQIISEGQVIVSLSLKDKQNQFVKKNATAFVGSDGLVGNKIVIIRPGNVLTIIEDNDTINALSPTDTQELFNIAKEVGVNARAISDDIKLISNRLNKGEGIFGELLREGPVALELRQAIGSVKRSGENMDRITQEASVLVHQINDGNGLVSHLLNDAHYPTLVDSTLQNLETTTKNAKSVSADLQVIVDNLKSNSNVAGVLLSDSLAAQELQRTLTNTNTASQKLDENMLAMQHNFLFRRYFRKQKKAEAKRQKEVEGTQHP